ncbi:hypothetical protein V8D89_002652, partial [Ganoderma adspersum]
MTQQGTTTALSGYLRPNPGPWLWEMEGYQPSGMAMPTLATHVSHPNLPSSSTTPPDLDPCHCFTDLEGTKWYQCLVCGKCIKGRFPNFRDHFKTHDPHRPRFDCYWPGCNQPFTRERDQRRHIEEDHLGTRPRRATSIRKKRNTGQRKTIV